MTFQETEEADPVWSPDGRSLLFLSVRSGPKSVLFRKPAGGAIPEERMVVDGAFYTYDTSPDGRQILLVQGPAAEQSSEVRPSINVVVNWAGLSK